MGTVLTGTVLSGSTSVNDTLEFPTLGLERKVKSMQMFKRKTTKISQGDRAGICVSSLDSNLLERGVAATPGGKVTSSDEYIPFCYGVLLYFWLILPHIFSFSSVSRSPTKGSYSIGKKNTLLST